MAHPLKVEAGKHRLMLLTAKGHKVPIEVDGKFLPIVVRSNNDRYFAASLVEDHVRQEGDRFIYLEIPIAQVESDVIPL